MARASHQVWVFAVGGFSRMRPVSGFLHHRRCQLADPNSPAGCRSSGWSGCGAGRRSAGTARVAGLQLRCSGAGYTIVGRQARMGMLPFMGRPAQQAQGLSWPRALMGGALEEHEGNVVRGHLTHLGQADELGHSVAGLIAHAHVADLGRGKVARGVYLRDATKAALNTHSC